MTALVRAELLKLRTVQMTAWLFVATLTVVGLEVLAFVNGAGEGEGPAQRHDPHLLAVAVASASAGEVIVMIMGILAMSHEFRFGSATSTFLVTPRRGHVVGAKLIALAVVGLGFALVSMAVVVPLSVWLIRARGGIVTWGGQGGDVVLGGGVGVGVVGPPGVAGGGPGGDQDPCPARGPARG